MSRLIIIVSFIVLLFVAPQATSADSLPSFEPQIGVGLNKVTNYSFKVCTTVTTPTTATLGVSARSGFFTVAITVQP